MNENKDKKIEDLKENYRILKIIEIKLRSNKENKENNKEEEKNKRILKKSIARNLTIIKNKSA